MSDLVLTHQQANQLLASVSSAKDAWEVTRMAEAARRWAQMRNLGTESVNLATGIKAKAMILLADFVDEGQAAGQIATPGANITDDNISRLADTIGAGSAVQAAQDVFKARQVRQTLQGLDVDQLVAEATNAGEDLGLRGLRLRAMQKREPREQKIVPPLKGTYSCLVVDPPWPMGIIDRDLYPSDPGKVYPHLELDQIADEEWVPVRTHAADNAHLYLWVTQRFLPAGLELMEAWGFRYQCVMTWVKNIGMVPYSWMYDTEHVLFGRRGSLPLLRRGLRLSFSAPVTRPHSQKPEVFYERVTQASPGPRIDMFARQPRDGFDVWGNEVEEPDADQ